MEKIEIEMCLGSSCYARGNSAALEQLEELIQEKSWEDSIELRGHLCMGKCADGPVMRMDGETFRTPDCDQLESMVKRRIEEAALKQKQKGELGKIKGEA